MGTVISTASKNLMFVPKLQTAKRSLLCLRLKRIQLGLERTTNGKPAHIVVSMQKQEKMSGQKQNATSTMGRKNAGNHALLCRTNVEKMTKKK